jgi:hypothetical protein
MTLFWFFFVVASCYLISSSIVMGTGTHLIAGNTYTYQIRINNNDASTWSAKYDFKPVPAVNTPATIGIYGGMSKATNSNRNCRFNGKVFTSSL